MSARRPVPAALLPFGLLGGLLGALVAVSAGRAHAAEEEPRPGLGISVGPLDFNLHGYFRAPLRLSLRSRGDGAKPGEALYNLRTPWLVDDDYFRSGFAYTRIQESDWSELYFSVGSKYLTGEVALMGSLYSDWARPLLDRQWGLAQAFLTFHWQSEGPRLKFRMHVKAGAFWDRFGWLENYDTYMFGRTHQMGAQVRMEFSGSRLTAFLLQGLGVHLEAIDANQGLTFLNYLHAGVRYKDLVQVGFYFLDALSQDQRQLKELADADMKVLGVDALLQSALTGRLYLAASVITASQATYLSPAIEVVHAYGGRGLAENYLGTDKSDNGTGSLYNLGLEHSFSLRALLDRRMPGHSPRLRGGDLSLRWFGMLTYTLSHQASPDPAINRDGRLSFKWGGQADWLVFSWLMLSLRYDRVIMDVQDDASSFRILTPRATLLTRGMLGAQIYLQYSRYFYGDRVFLRPGQVALETLPDTDVFKIQAQLVF